MVFQARYLINVGNSVEKAYLAYCRHPTFSGDENAVK